MPDEIEIPYKFECRPYQVPAWEALESGQKRVVCCWHRGAGKDLFALNYLIYKALRKKAVYLHCFPQYAQGKRAIWKSIHNTDDGSAMSYLDHFPPEIIKHKNSTEMSIELINGSIYCILGLDGKNAQLARGMNPSFIILSEYAYMDRQSWETVEPRITQNNGTALFLSTPNGQNHFYQLYNHAKNNDDPDYFASLLTIEDTKTVTANQIEKLRLEGTPEDFIQQEYYCSFTRGAEGSYYGKQIQLARDEERLSVIRIKKDLPCHTSWDIGIGDSTAIWIFQVLPNSNINVLDYYENQGEPLEHYLRYLDKWKTKNEAIFGTHYVPHDMQNREFTSGVDRLTSARELGYIMTIVPRKSLAEGIQAVRAVLGSCSFDFASCKHGLKCLEFYRKKYNESLKCYYDEPCHDYTSHGSDAFRMMAVGIKAIPPKGPGGLNAEKITDMRMKFYGY